MLEMNTLFKKKMMPNPVSKCEVIMNGKGKKKGYNVGSIVAGIDNRYITYLLSN